MRKLELIKRSLKKRKEKLRLKLKLKQKHRLILKLRRRRQEMRSKNELKCLPKVLPKPSFRLNSYRQAKD